MNDFEKFEPGAWHQKGVVSRPDMAPPPRRSRPQSPSGQGVWPVAVALSVLSIGLNSSQVAMAAPISAVGSAYFSQLRPDTSVTEEFPEGPDIDSQIGDLRQLDRGWYDGAGEAFEQEFLDELTGIFKQACRLYRVPRPYLYPTPRGEVSAEWTLREWELDVTVSSQSRRAHAMAVNVRTHESEEEEFSIRNEKSAERIGRFVARYEKRA